MKKIMFNDHYGLTQAVLEGRKTQTRRTFLKPGEESLLHGIIFVKTPICNNFNVSRFVILLFFVTH